MSLARLTPLEVASGIVTGVEPEAAELPAAADADPRRALEEHLAELLAAGPCAVALSGGYDSSALLALAQSVAGREGLEPPAALSMSFPGFEHTDETEWQSALVEHLGLKEWRRIEIRDEIDLIGPHAQAALRRHGLLFPANSHVHAPLLAESAGATLISGVGGDEVFGWRWTRLAEIARLRAAPRPSDLRQLALVTLPRPAARALLARGTRLKLGWLTEEARRRVHATFADWVVRAPRSFAGWLERTHRSRYLRSTRASLELLAEDAGARIALPLAEPRFIASLARRGAKLGPGSRERTWRELFSDLVPDRLLGRGYKADYTPVLFGAHSQAFAQAWRGEGADPELVNIANLQEIFKVPRLRIATGLLVQDLWLKAG